MQSSPILRDIVCAATLAGPTTAGMTTAPPCTKHPHCTRSSPRGAQLAARRRRRCCCSTIGLVLVRAVASCAARAVSAPPIRRLADLSAAGAAVAQPASRSSKFPAAAAAAADTVCVQVPLLRTNTQQRGNSCFAKINTPRMRRSLF